MTLLTGQQPGQGNNAPAAGDAGNQGHNATDWRAALPEDLRSEKVFESIKGKDWNEAGPLLAKNYVHAQRLVGADKLVLPTEKSTPEEIKAFRQKLGVPEKPEEYGYKLPEGLTEDKLDKARVDLWRKEMHEAGIPKAAAERLLNKYLAEEHGSLQAQLAARDKEIEGFELKTREMFGDKFEEKLNLARWAAKEFGNEELMGILEQSGLGSHPSVVAMLAKIGESLSEGGPRGGGSGTGSPEIGSMSPETATAALNAFNRDQEKQKALWNDQHPQHDAVVKERAALVKAAFPPKKTAGDAE